MRYKTLFRLGLKLLGVWLLVGVVLQLPRIVPEVILFFSEPGLTPPAGGWSPYGGITWMIWTEFALELFLGLYLFFGGRLIANLAIPSNRPHCPECGYELIANTAGSCPECGTVVATRAADPPVTA